jgi:hypothetical protein
MVQMTFDKIVGVVSMCDRLMAATSPVLVIRFVAGADMPRGALIGVF